MESKLSLQELATAQRYAHLLMALRPDELYRTWLEVFGKHLHPEALQGLQHLCMDITTGGKVPLSLEEETQHAIPLKVRVVMEPHVWDIGGFLEKLPDILPIVRYIEQNTAPYIKRKDFMVVLVPDDGDYIVKVQAPDDESKTTITLQGKIKAKDWYEIDGGEDV